MRSLEFTLDRDPERYRVRLQGALDERADLDQLFAALDHDAVFDMSGVTRVNSIGVQRWITRCRKFASEHHLFIEAASYVVVTQANCIADFFGGATIRSCLAPYFCPKCQESVTVLVRVDEVARSGEPPSKACLTCGSALEFDELENYFAFALLHAGT